MILYYDLISWSRYGHKTSYPARETYVIWQKFASRSSGGILVKKLTFLYFILIDEYIVTFLRLTLVSIIIQTPPYARIKHAPNGTIINVDGYVNDIIEFLAKKYKFT